MGMRRGAAAGPAREAGSACPRDSGLRTPAPRLCEALPQRPSAHGRRREAGRSVQDAGGAGRKVNTLKLSCTSRDSPHLARVPQPAPSGRPRCPGRRRRSGGLQALRRPESGPGQSRTGGSAVTRPAAGLRQTSARNSASRSSTAAMRRSRSSSLPKRHGGEP